MRAPPPSPAGPSALALSPVAALLLVLAAAAQLGHARLYGPFVTDDAYISFVYARNLAEHGRLVWNLGEPPVEGYTNFLWTVLLAGLLRLGWQPESSSIVLGLVLSIASFGVVAHLSRRLWLFGPADAKADASGGARASGWDALPALVLAAVPGYACWAGGGLETQLFTFLFTLGATGYLIGGPGPAAGLAFGLAALTRPEGDLFFALTFLHAGLARVLARRPLLDRALLGFGLTFSSLVLPHFLWRRRFYGWWLPNTFYIKSSGGAGTWAHGAHYLWRFSSDFLLPLLAALALGGLWLARRRSPGLARLLGYLALVVPAFFVYVASVGGDFMGLYRFALPIVPLLAGAAALGLRALCWRLPAPRLAAPLLAAALLGSFVWHDRAVVREALRTEASVDRGVIDTPGYLRWYTEDRAAIGRWFGQYARPDDYMVVGGAGAQVYYSRIPSLDCFGLSDPYIAHSVRAVSDRPGHQKYAPVDYQIARRPTIITSNYYAIAGGPVERPDAPWWRSKGYRYVSVRVPGLSSPWYSFLLRMDRSLGPLGAVDADLN